VEVWAAAWEAADVEAVASLYTPDAVFHSHPFRAAQNVREYVVWAFGDQAAAECRFGTPLVDGDRAAVDWWAVITLHDGTAQTIAGTSLIRFDDDGRVVEQRDAWAEVEGRRDAPAWAPGEPPR
jgi:ketosteroid isomerase-like protein